MTKIMFTIKMSDMSKEESKLFMKEIFNYSDRQINDGGEMSFYCKYTRETISFLKQFNGKIKVLGE